MIDPNSRRFTILRSIALRAVKMTMPAAYPLLTRIYAGEFQPATKDVTPIEIPSEIGVCLPGAARDGALLFFDTTYDKAADFAEWLDSRMRTVDFLRTYAGKQYECTFDPAEDPIDLKAPEVKIRPIEYFAVITSHWNSAGYHEHYIILIRIRDGKRAGGILDGNNGTQLMHQWMNGWDGWAYAEREVKAREFHHGSKNLPRLSSDYGKAITTLLEQFNKEQ